MMLQRRLILLWLALGCLGSTMDGIARAQSAPADDLTKLAWMAGAWIERKAGGETEEHWMAPKAGLMLGTNRSVSSAGKASFEFLRIAKTSSGISYFASPRGRSATEFPLVESSEHRAVFENPKHDFPQRIIYWREDGALRARIEGTLAGQKRSKEWRWERAKN